MSAWLRPYKKLAKINYQLLNTPKDLRQKNDKVPDEKRLASWKIGSSPTS
jgi:hypothetical protein